MLVLLTRRALQRACTPSSTPFQAAVRDEEKKRRIQERVSGSCPLTLSLLSNR
jgi:hypothetical protein